MANFKIGSMKATVSQAADSIVNNQSVMSTANDIPAVIDLLAAIRDELRRAESDPSLSPGRRTEIAAVGRELGAETAAAPMDPKRLVAVLNRVRSLTVGLATLAGVAAAVDRLIHLLAGSS